MGKLSSAAPIIQTHTALVHVFKGVHINISVLFSSSDTWFATQIALLRATKDGGAKRSAPSEFGVGIKATPQMILLL